MAELEAGRLVDAERLLQGAAPQENEGAKPERTETEMIVTHNTRDFSAASDFGLRLLTPQDLMQILRESS